MGLIGSRSVRLVLATLGSAPAPAQSGLIAQLWVLFGSGPPRVEHPLSPTRRHPVQLQASRAIIDIIDIKRLKDLVEMNVHLGSLPDIQFNTQTRACFVTETSGSGTPSGM
jgi:hypothetical protein